MGSWTNLIKARPGVAETGHRATLRRCLRGLLLAAACTALLVTDGGPGHAVGLFSPAPDKLERLTEFFDHEVATGKLPGAVVLIQQHGRPIYLKCFGVRDTATGVPMTPDTIFALHSMTKPITSLAAMMLIDEGRLKLSDPVAKYIPSFADVKVGVAAPGVDGAPALGWCRQCGRSRSWI